MTNQPLRRKNRSTTSLHLLEPLELRALFSAVIALSGNGSSISTGDITPSSLDFTNFGFMSTTPNAAIGQLTHAFSITNAGDGTLSLTGGIKPIKITGPNAGDFSIVTLPSTSITAGTVNATTFVVAFTPHGTGTRKATITIPSNDTGTPNFTFVVQGTGVKTINYTTGIQIATTTIGTGTGKAIPGSQLTVNFAEYLTNGTLIDTSDPNVNPGRTPFEFILGIGDVISGWDQGLVGLKQSESRVLFIPATFAYGSTGSGNIPPNAPLIFTVDDVTLEQPLVAVSGNDINIAFNDTTPSSTDGTIIGTTVAGATSSIDFTFKVINDGQGVIFYPNNNVVITGKNAANFTTTALATQNGFATFTVTYHPAANAGTHNAVVNIITNDPLHPNFKFNVSGVTTPFNDLSATVATANYAAPIITGSTTLYKIPVKITNQGNVSVPKDSPPVTFDIFLHNATGGPDTLLTVLGSTALRNLGVGKTSTVNLSLPIPITVPTGTYQFLIKVNEGHAITETDYADNVPLSTQILSMTQGFYDLTATIGTSNLPTSGQIISGASTVFKVPVTITNSGNLRIPSNADPIAFRVYLANATGGPDTFVNSISSTSLRNLAVGGVFKTTLTTQIPIVVPTGNFQFLFKLNETSTLTESTLSNNNPLSSQTFSITQGVYNISGNLSTSSFVTTIAANSPLSGKLTFTVKNDSNLTLPSNQKLNFQMIAISDLDDTQIPIGPITTVSVGNWAAEKTGNFSITKSLLAGLTAGSYHLAVLITSTPDLLQTTDDNLLDETSSHGTFALTVT